MSSGHDVSPLALIGEVNNSIISVFDSVSEGEWGCVDTKNFINADHNVGNSYSTIRFIDPDFDPSIVSEVWDAEGLPNGHVSQGLKIAEDRENYYKTGNIPYLNYPPLKWRGSSPSDHPAANSSSFDCLHVPTLQCLDCVSST